MVTNMKNNVNKTLFSFSGLNAIIRIAIIIAIIIIGAAP